MEDSIFIAVQDQTGDSKMKMQWNKNDEEAKEMAKREFKRLQEQGYRIFSVRKVLGFINIKGKELESLDPDAGEMYYEAGESDKASESEPKSTFSKKDVEADNISYEDPKKFDIEKEEIDVSRDYVATKPLYAG